MVKARRLPIVNGSDGAVRYADAPRKLATIPALIGSEIVKGIESNGRRWLFFQSKTRAPFAVDLGTGNAATFQIPGVKIPGA